MRQILMKNTDLVCKVWWFGVLNGVLMNKKNKTLMKTGRVIYAHINVVLDKQEYNESSIITESFLNYNKGIKICFKE